MPDILDMAVICLDILTYTWWRHWLVDCGHQAVSTFSLTRCWHGNGMEVLNRYRNLDWSKVIHMCITWWSTTILTNWNLYKLQMLTYKHSFHVQRLIINKKNLNQHNIMDLRCCLLYIQKYACVRWAYHPYGLYMS